MEWISPVSTALGAVIGVGSTLLAERLRWRRDRITQAHATRQQLYADYSAALSRMRTALSEYAHAVQPVEERARRVRELFLAPGAYELRHQLAILAPREVIDASQAAFLVLRETRDCLVAGADADSASYRELDEAFDGAIGRLRTVMRRDLGVSDHVVR
ncbi:hypothetical protein [Streptomyces sp. NPDC008141]|uniref:hypothetical protein n=1 Tax=Streptomyces sp. NPDC008141 TaxID=3364815 RepID=UPI0036EC5211